MPHPSATVYDMTSTTTTTAAAPLVAHGRIEADMPRNNNRAERVANSDPRIALLNPDARVVAVVGNDDRATAWLIANRSRGAMRYTVNGATYLVVGTPTSYVDPDKRVVVIHDEPSDDITYAARPTKWSADLAYYGAANDTQGVY